MPFGSTIGRCESHLGEHYERATCIGYWPTQVEAVIPVKVSIETQLVAFKEVIWRLNYLLTRNARQKADENPFPMMKLWP